MVHGRTPGNGFEHLDRALRLHPDLVDHGRIRKPSLVGPLGVRHPDIQSSKREQGGVNDFDKHIDFGFGAVRLLVRNVSDLGVGSQHVCKEGVQNLGVLSQPRKRSGCTDQIDSHCVRLGCVS